MARKPGSASGGSLSTRSSARLKRKAVSISGGGTEVPATPAPTRGEEAASAYPTQAQQPDSSARPSGGQKKQPSKVAESSSEASSPFVPSQGSPEPEASPSPLKARRRSSGVNKRKSGATAARPSPSQLRMKQEESDGGHGEVDEEEVLGDKEAADLKRKELIAAARAKRNADSRAKRDAARRQKFQEMEVLKQQPRVAPAPWALQLPALPPRQNITGRALPLKLLPQDDSFPLTQTAREAHVADILEAMRDVQQAQDTISGTTDFRYLWLKPSLEGRFTYDEVDMERVARKLVSIAEGLHAHGLGATEIYCPRTIKKAQDADAMSFQVRIDKLALLMRKSKARCNAFMLNNTLEDTLAVIDIKVSDQVSNLANNKLRSVKLDRTNNLLGMHKGARWPKDENKQPMIPTWDSPAPDAAPEGINVGVTMENQEEDNGAQHPGNLQAGSEQGFWLEATEQYPPIPQEEAEIPPLYPMSEFGAGFGYSQASSSLPETFYNGERRELGLDPYAANIDFDLMYSSHHGRSASPVREERLGSEFFDFEGAGEVEEEEEGPSFKRTRYE